MLFNPYWAEYIIIITIKDIIIKISQILKKQENLYLPRESYFAILTQQVCAVQHHSSGHHHQDHDHYHQYHYQPHWHHKLFIIISICRLQLAGCEVDWYCARTRKSGH